MNIAQYRASIHPSIMQRRVNINARDTVSFDGMGSNGTSSTAESGVEDTAVGKGGNINITTGSLSMTNGAELLAYTNGQGDAGSVNINARDTVSFDGVSSDTVDPVASGVFSTVDPKGVGNGGAINITTGTLFVTNGAQLQASTSGRGSAGSVMITARDTISFDGVGSEGFPSSAFSSVDYGATGNGGGIDISTGSLSLTNGGRLDARTLGQGNAGNIQVNAADSVELSGKTPDGSPSGLFASSIGTGDAGDLKVTTKQLNILNGARLFAATALGNGGNITLQAQDLLLLRNQSQISTSAGTADAGGDGGNIDIDSQFIVAFPSENSDITANAFEGRGGNIRITTQGIFGTEFRDRLTPESDITASSEFGISGVVEINTPDVDPSLGLVALPAEVVDVSGLIASGCGAGGRQGSSKFIVTGRGGLPIRPIDANISPYPTGTVRSIPSSDPSSETSLFSVEGSDHSTNPTPAAPTQIVEARGWVINNKGEVVLTTQAPNVTPHIPWLPSATCQASSSSS